MAHFAKLDENNVVIDVNVVHNNELLDENGVEQEQKGIDFLVAWSGGHPYWKQTSYNGSKRKNYAGRGYTTEAVNVLTAFAFENLGLHRVEINIRPENGSSIRVAEKAGYHFEGDRPQFLHIAGSWRDHRCFVKVNDLVR